MNKKFSIALVIILAVALLRILPHPSNVSPIAAIALFGGSVFTNKYFKFILPLLVVFVSDVLLNTFVYNMSPFYTGWYIQYSIYAIIAVIGTLVNSNNIKSIIAGSLTGSILFFLLSNLGVWLIGGLGYTYNLTGFLTCYTAAIPFFQNTILGDLFFNALVFGCFYLVFQKSNKQAIIAA